MPKLALIVGSRRDGSYNNELLDYLANYLSPDIVVERLNGAALDLPIFDQTIEADPQIRSRAIELHGRLGCCDGMMVASPEYNGQITPLLKNAVDWVSRVPHFTQNQQNAFLDKPVLLASASTGRSGGFASIAHARALFGHVGALVLGGAICLPGVEQFWTPFGLQMDETFDSFASAMIGRLERISSARSRNFL